MTGLLEGKSAVVHAARSMIKKVSSARTVGEVLSGTSGYVTDTTTCGKVLSSSSCPRCGGDGLMDVAINCKHSKSSSHQYCSHDKTTQHDD